MALNTTVMSDQYSKLLVQLPVTVTYGGTNYEDCSRTQKSLDRLYMDAGRLEQYSFSVLCSPALRDAGPGIDEKVTIDGTTYRILSTDRDAAGVELRLDLGPEYAQ